MSTAFRAHPTSVESTSDVAADTQDDDASTRKKLSHGRKLAVDHIPRPRNAFILFRTNFVEESKLTRGTESDNRNISKIAGAVWRALPQEEKLVWHKKATEEKEQHKLKYPNYKYRPVLRKEAVCRRKVKQKLWEGVESDEETEADLTGGLQPSPSPSTSANLPPVDAIAPSALHRREGFRSDEGDSLAPVYTPWSIGSTSFSPLTIHTMAHSYETPPSSAPSTSPDPTSLTPLPSSSLMNKPKDRCDVIAELYAKGWRGEELEAEVRRREEEGRRRRGVDAAEESKPVTVLTMSKAKIRDMERKQDQEAKEKRAVLVKAAMERWKSLKASSKAKVEKNARQPLAFAGFNPYLPSPDYLIIDGGYHNPFQLDRHPEVIHGVPLGIFPPPSRPIPNHASTELGLSAPVDAEGPFIPSSQPPSRGRDTRKSAKTPLTGPQQPQDYPHPLQQASGSSEGSTGLGPVTRSQTSGRNRGHKRKRSISQPSSPSSPNHVYAQLGVQTMYPHVHNAGGWSGATPYSLDQSRWVADVNQHHPPKPTNSPSSHSAPDISLDSPSYPGNLSRGSHEHSALRATRSLVEGSVQEGSKWDQVCRSWEDRGGPLNLGPTLYHLAHASDTEGPSIASCTLAPEVDHNGDPTEGVTPLGLRSQQACYGPDAQWALGGDDGHSTSVAPIDIGAQYAFSPAYAIHHPVAQSWSADDHGVRDVMLSALIDLEADSDNLSPEDMTPSQSSESFGHSSQSMPPPDSSVTMAGEFGLGLGLVYAAQSPAEPSF